MTPNARERKFALRFDLEQQGLLRVFKPWHAEAMRFLWGRETEAISRMIWEHLKASPYPMSRASVIYFLDDMKDLGFVDITEKTGKGGYHKVYRAVQGSEAEFRQEVVDRLTEAVGAFLAR